MFRNARTPALIALCAAVATTAALTGCAEKTKAGGLDTVSGRSASSAERKPATFTGAKKIDVNGLKINVSCSGSPQKGKPVVVLLHGGGDNLKKFAGLQKTLGERERVCSYDRLGAGASDKPVKKQTLNDAGKVLTGVIDHVAGDSGAVLAGHSLGGLIAGRYAPGHQDKVKGVVLMDATSPTQIADLHREIPADATGMAAQLRDETLAVFRGADPEKLVVRDAKVRSAGDIPVQVIQHGVKYLEQVPEYGPGLEQAWADGQRKWLALSGRSALGTAQKSEHYIYLDQPDVAVTAILQVAAQAAAQGQG
ncbi:alpha/beta hydrolase [Streptomyces sp. A7024]|uniref:Alpha/beta hydrolase n=1 Tax=Streptomyces coryli TaxID=1128680 RepID=A0A6G4TZB8_9ACTN|nr:alpha/beta hydrolase [Streptomyces coryli]NGN65325.1 alpha/beta hydrolase [Streptomyces coryli]